MTTVCVCVSVCLWVNQPAHRIAPQLVAFYSGCFFLRCKIHMNRHKVNAIRQRQLRKDCGSEFPDPFNVLFQEEEEEKIVWVQGAYLQLLL